MLTAIFNNISVISWRSLSLVEETRILREKPTTRRNLPDNLYHIILYRVHFPWVGFKLTALVVTGTGSCKSNYHVITTAPIRKIQCIWKQCNTYGT